MTHSVTRLIVTFIAIFGGFWTIIEAIGFFFESSFGNTIKNWNNGLGFWILFLVSLVVSILINHYNTVIDYFKRVFAKRKPVKILVVRSRPEWLMEMLGRTNSNIKKVSGYGELKPEYISDVESDDKIIKNVFRERENNQECVVKILNPATKSNVAETLLEKWDIVHFDCVVASPKAELCLEDGRIQPHAMREILRGKDIKLLVLMDCDSLQIALTTKEVGVESMVAITHSLPVTAGEKFTQGFYKSIESGLPLKESFQIGKQFSATEIEQNYADQLFVFDGNPEKKYFKDRSNHNS